MLSNRSKDTGPEVRLRSELHRLGLRFFKNRSVRAGGIRTRPDAVFPRARVAVFVDGCFWHRCPSHGSDPKANDDYWRLKLDRNVHRDRIVDAALAVDGWLVIRVWEHEPPAKAASRVAAQVKARR
jgi:DNA mismatch endonuclease (patch repair protein)